VGAVRSQYAVGPIADGCYQGTGLVIPHRRERGQSERGSGIQYSKEPPF
jgi:hypothetical protein